MIRLKRKTALINKLLNSTFKKSLWYRADGTWGDHKDNKRGLLKKITFYWVGEDTIEEKKESIWGFIDHIESELNREANENPNIIAPCDGMLTTAKAFEVTINNKGFTTNKINIDEYFKALEIITAQKGEEDGSD